MTERSSSMSSVLRAFAVLEVLWETNGAGPSEIADRLNVPKSTAHAHLSTLAETGYVINDDGDYRLGYKFLTTGSRIKHRNGLFQVAEEFMTDLADRTGELVSLVVEQSGQAVILHKASGDRSLELGIYSGMTTPLHTNATGKTILASLPDERTDEILDARGLTRVTDETITDEETLRAELEEIRERGYAVDWDQQVTGMGLVAAPIVVNDRLEGAIGIVGPTGRITDEDYQRTLVKTLQETIDSITIKYRYGT
ncbi:IclR family transcriptional regulator [Halosolutus gelatinilyticus]|uniref:IclR family transcriptional regulator n=1 Tax=Halosolutus gelatinilyticus TaxID=2931975 RepID=UPI001FF1BDC4|nr:IclR family transcriptional regulator [Halosolutus gelatinilyticus]